MKPALPLLLMLLASPALTGCVRFAETRTVVWARMGTPARIIDERPVRVLVPAADGGWEPAEGVLTGMVALDEPTLELYQRQEAEASHGR